MESYSFHQDEKHNKVYNGLNYQNNGKIAWHAISINIGGKVFNISLGLFRLEVDYCIATDANVCEDKPGSWVKSVIEIVVVDISYAVIKCVTVMIKSRDTPITVSTMLRSLKHTWTAYIAIIFVVWAMEAKFVIIAYLLQHDGGISGVRARGC